MAGLRIRTIINSGVGQIFDFKTCCGARAFDQNLEILLTNDGPGPVIVSGWCDLETEAGLERIDYLMPHGPQRLAPGETKGFYCTMDETRWSRVRRVIFYDQAGHRHAAAVEHEPEAE